MGIDCARIVHQSMRAQQGGSQMLDDVAERELRVRAAFRAVLQELLHVSDAFARACREWLGKRVK